MARQEPVPLFRRQPRFIVLITSTPSQRPPPSSPPPPPPPPSPPSFSSVRFAFYSYYYHMQSPPYLSRNQAVRTPLTRRRILERGKLLNSFDLLIRRTQRGVMQKTESSGQTEVSTLNIIKPSSRSATKPRPPLKPRDLALRSVTWSQASSVEQSLTNETSDDAKCITTSTGSDVETATMASVSTNIECSASDLSTNDTSSTTNKAIVRRRSARPRLAPPPPPPKPTTKSQRNGQSSDIQLKATTDRLSCIDVPHQLAQSQGDPPHLRSSWNCDQGPIPSVPTIPVPCIPSLSVEENISGEYACYERIDYEDMSSENSNNQNVFESKAYAERKRISDQSDTSLMHSSSRHSFSLPDSNLLFRVPDRPQTATLKRKKISTYHSGSIELDKFLRLKSNLQQNISRKMDQLRQKVGDKRIWTGARCESLKDITFTRRYDVSDVGSQRKLVTSPVEDLYIYGDEWSSDDDNDDQNAYDDRRSSMYKELEQYLKRTFPLSQMESEYEYDSADGPSEDYLRCPSTLPFAELSITSSVVDEQSPEEEDYAHQYTSRLPMDQPLYQIYMLAENNKLFDGVLLRASDSTKRIGSFSEEQGKPNNMSCTSIDLFRRESCTSSDSGRGADCSTSASALTSTTSMKRERLIASSHFGSQRSLWCELEEVKAAGLLDTLDEETKIRQEAYFEVITSEASYLRSLNILITHFMASQELMGSKSSFSVISNSERKHLFSNIFAVRDCSERLLSDLETRLEQNLMLDDLCILLESGVPGADTTPTEGREPCIFGAVSKMEADKQCQGLDMRSFLMLPMQRVTRYPLLVYAILDRLQREGNEYEVTTRALNAANKVVGECNEGARRMERTEQLLDIDSRLIYKDPDLKKIALVSNSRYLVKRGSLVQLLERKNRNILQGKQKTRNIYIFLFSDIILVTKKKLNGTYECKDYAGRRYVDVQPLECDVDRMSTTSLNIRPHLFLCVFMRNAHGRQVEFLLNAESETDRERWLSALRPPTSANPLEKIYAEWDCPQAVAVHSYNKNQDDELSLEVGDMVNILRKMPDGWFYGHKEADGLSGWFPSSYVQQILNDHVRGQ
ncbi:hypothetical protein KIN20_010973 [Parelaphostrongylus tenuis]|uniref:Rho guanine nucleotide exchange factor 26 n=1 Tax=Parelaphostrongylus tenuis TaxID=148309 RepID=A0AAD5MUR4_PARTN|nr:hypothetical protein KIN20_010973 [Parelaphostrongylus tenuis]